MNNIKKTVCVLGMHRSGTSLIAKILNQLGVDFGATDQFLPAGLIDNPYGFYENKNIVELQDNILNLFNRNCYSCSPLPNDWWKNKIIKPHIEELKRLIRKEFNHSEFWGWKDPRTCLLLPMWQEEILHRHNSIHYLISFRNPLDVAKSLNFRNDISISGGMRLWYYYMINVLKHTTNLNRIFISYENLVKHTDENIKRIIDWLGFSKDHATNRIIGKSVINDLWRNRSTFDELTKEAGFLVSNLYSNLLKSEFDNRSIKLSNLYELSTYDAFSGLMDSSILDKYEQRIFPIHKCYLLVKNKDNSGQDIYKFEYRLFEGDENQINYKLELNNPRNVRLYWKPSDYIPIKVRIESVRINKKLVEFNCENQNLEIEGFNVFLNVEPIYRLFYESSKIYSIEIRTTMYIPNEEEIKYLSFLENIHSSMAYRISRRFIDLKKKIKHRLHSLKY